MFIAGRFDIVRTSVLVLGLALLYCRAEGRLHHLNGVAGRRGLVDTTTGSAVKVFDVTEYGAKADGKTDSTMAFMRAWKDSCKSSTVPSKLLVPEGDFKTAPVIFQGPCTSSVPIIVEVQGNLRATDDLSEYFDDHWFLFERINGLVLTGGGTFDGRGVAAWQYNDCKKNKDCMRLPTSIKLLHVNNSVVYNIKSINSKYFHMHITDCNDFTAYNLKIIAPDNSPNTDGMHISDTSHVNVSNSIIGTGDDCISIGQGVTNATITKIFCGPGHGISIGSLGKNEDEKEVNGIVVKNCTLSGTDNGVRIKTFAASPPGIASSITFEDIIMNNVTNPIIIDQKYGSRSQTKPSRVKITDVHYKNIRGTSTSNVAVNLLCSSMVPCEGVELANIDLSYSGNSEKNKTITSACTNAKVTCDGKQNPAACHQ